MKTNIIFLFTTIAILGMACEDDKAEPSESSIVGIWQLVEVLADPGDGSGVFQPSTTEKTVTFFDDGTVTTTGSFCAFGQGSGTANTAVYSEEAMTITSPECEALPGMQLTYEIDGDELIIRYVCIEPCAEKYRRVLFRD